MSFWRNLPSPIVGLAPMDGVTDAAFRWMVAREGKPDVVFTEFTNVNDVCRGPDRLMASLIYSEVERPVVAQLYGKDPDLFYVAAQVVCELGFDGLDINMGCPSKSVASSGSGAGLIRTPVLAHEIMQAARQGIHDWAAGRPLEANVAVGANGLKTARLDLVRTMNRMREGNGQNGEPQPRRAIPLSVKTRLGYDSVTVESWVAHLLEAQPSVISVHGRTLQQMYRGEADWSAIARAAEVVKGTDTLLLGNGDVRSLEEAMRRVRETGVHGVLVGRGTLGHPWFFRRLAEARALAAGAALQQDTGTVAVTRDDRFRIMLDHARQFEAVAGVDRFPRMRKHLGWYCKGFPGAAAMRAQMVRVNSSADVERLVADYLTAASDADRAEWSPADRALEAAPLPPSLSCA